jgi:hypothetical protein
MHQRQFHGMFKRERLGGRRGNPKVSKQQRQAHKSVNESEGRFHISTLNAEIRMQFCLRRFAGIFSSDDLP